MKKIKAFFGINDSFKFEWADLSALLTVANVALIVAGIWWAPIFGLANCALNILLGIFKGSHVNGYVSSIALIILNLYFLGL